MTDLKLSAADIELIIAALAMMQEVDEEHGHESCAAQTRDLIERIEKAAQ